MTTLFERATAFQHELVELRRDVHRHPELAFQEVRTAAAAARHVRVLGFDVRLEVARTGLVAELANGDGPVVALRADMDALPIREANDVPWRSSVDGVMHACGHDAHVAMLVGAARLLAAARADGTLPAGTVRLLFQPSEERADRENKSGARRMIEEGALEGVTAIFGTHVGGTLPVGRAYLRAGPMMAGSDAFSVVVTGRGAHAAPPHEGVDAIVLAAHAILACQTAVARRLAPDQAGVLTVGLVRGGVAENVLAERVAVRGTVRYFEDSVRGALHRELHNAFGVVEAMGGSVKVDVRTGYPPVVNDADLTELARAAIRDALGEEAVDDAAPVMLSEDFAFYQREVPGCFFWIGAALPTPREHHTAHFDIDESALSRGAAALAACAMAGLTR